MGKNKEIIRDKLETQERQSAESRAGDLKASSLYS
jgi:hypothetical protein